MTDGRWNWTYLDKYPKVNKSLDSALNNISNIKLSLHNKAVVNSEYRANQLE